jgi:hypothetical protein
MCKLVRLPIHIDRPTQIAAIAAPAIAIRISAESVRSERRAWRVGVTR